MQPRTVRICMRHTALRRMESGLTLLELLIIAAIVAGIVLVALPTLQPTAEEAIIEQIKTNLRYLAAQEEEYFVRYGTYAPLTKIAEDPAIGKTFDQRFAVEAPVVDGVVYTGPQKEATVFDIVAEIPKTDERDAIKYKIDGTGEVKTL